MVPEGWTKTTIAQSISVGRGFAFRSEQYREVGYPILRVTNIAADGSISVSDNCKYLDPVEANDYQRFALKAGDILLVMVGATTGKIGFVRSENLPALLNQNMWSLRAKASSGIDQSFFSYIVSDVVEKFMSTLQGSARGFLTQGDFSKQPFAHPPLPEQHKIAEILSTWDKAIETTEALLANARTQKRALMQSLLTGTRRFPGFEGQPWREVRFDTVFERVKRKNTVGEMNVLTISGQDGLVSQNTYFNKRVASADLRGYTLLKGGDFAYNKSYSNGYPMGAIKVLPRDITGVVSSLYLCFRLRPMSPHSLRFFQHYFEAGCFDDQIAAIAQEGARNHGLLNVSISEFFETNVRIPSPREQEQIANAIDLFEAEETATRNSLESLRAEKKSLMQQLLTGKRRVVV